MTGTSTINDPAWLARVLATIERLQAQLAKEPNELYFQLCLRGWEAELARIERRDDAQGKAKQ